MSSTTLRINMWSSPRNLSTALMYAWRQRADTTVVDEPLYAHYLHTTGRRHPGAAEVLAAQDNDGDAVVRDVVLGEYATPIVFHKQMAKHLVGLDRSFLPLCRNVLLTRDPHDMLTSLQVQLPDTTLADTGFPEMIEILDVLTRADERPIVIDSKLLLQHPERVLTALCEELGIEFEDVMLSWPPGPKPEDGVWAKYWYESVHRSTGWEAWRPKDAELLPSVVDAYEQAVPLYERLLPYRIG